MGCQLLVAEVGSAVIAPVQERAPHGVVMIIPTHPAAERQCFLDGACKHHLVGTALQMQPCSTVVGLCLLSRPHSNRFDRDGIGCGVFESIAA